MKKSDLIFSAILVPLDYCMIVLAAISAYFLRYENWVQEIRPVIFNLEFNDFFSYVWKIAFGWLIIFAIADLYHIQRSRKIANEVSKIFLACSTAMLAVIVGAFFSRELFDSRFILLATWILCIIYVIIFRLIIFGIQKLFYKKGKCVQKVIVVGFGKSAQEIIKEISQNKSLGYKLIKHISNPEQIFSADLKNIDEIISADVLSKKDKLALLNLTEEKHILFRYAADVLQAQNIKLDTLAGVPIVEVQKTKLDGWAKILKRLFDILISFIFLIIFIPFCIIFSIIIKIDSRGPIFYGSKRIGSANRKITVWKFRSMIKNAEKMKKNLLKENERAGGPLFKIKNDPRVTRFGKFMRKTSIDELPQLWNVFIGQMSLVGPRPHELHEVEQYESHQKKLLNIKPGITGLAQVSGRSDLDFNEEVKLDIFYIENWSFKLDCIIFLKTFWVVLSGKGGE